MYIVQWDARCMFGFASTKDEKESEQPFSGATLYFRRTQRGSIDSGHFIYKGL